jgi:hypothetical protein
MKTIGKLPFLTGQGIGLSFQFSAVSAMYVSWSGIQSRAWARSMRNLRQTFYLNKVPENEDQKPQVYASWFQIEGKKWMATPGAVVTEKIVINVVTKKM